MAVAVAVVTGTKLVEVCGNVAVVVADVDVGNEKGALVVAVVVDGVENGNAGVVVVEAAVVVAGIGNENDGID